MKPDATLVGAALVILWGFCEHLFHWDPTVLQCNTSFLRGQRDYERKTLHVKNTCKLYKVAQPRFKAKGKLWLRSLEAGYVFSSICATSTLSRQWIKSVKRCEYFLHYINLKLTSAVLENRLGVHLTIPFVVIAVALTFHAFYGKIFLKDC